MQENTRLILRVAGMTMLVGGLFTLVIPVAVGGAVLLAGTRRNYE